MQPVSINWGLVEYEVGGEFIDANMRIYVNETLQVEAFGTFTGQIQATQGDTIRVQYFYLAGLFAGTPTDPRLQLYINNIITEDQPLVLENSSTFNYTFTIVSDTIIEVESFDAG